MAAPAAHATARALLVMGRVALAAVFLFAAYSKLFQPTPHIATNAAFFALQVDSYRLLPTWAVPLVARTLPWLELGLGVLLLVGYPLRSVTVVTSALLLSFFSLMVRTYAMGLEINCGCFGPGETLGAKTLVRDGLLLALSLAVTLGAFIAARSKPPVAALAPEKADS
jgi:putative oxidoreductase